MADFVPQKSSGLIFPGTNIAPLSPPVPAKKGRNGFPFRLDYLASRFRLLLISAFCFQNFSSCLLVHDV